MKVFLGGTCNESLWRKELIEYLEIDFFNPVVEDWTPECMEEEIKQRKECDICLYVISKEMTRTYSIAEVIDDSNKRPKNTVFCIIKNGFNESQIKSLKQVGKMVNRNGGSFVSWADLPEFLNNFKI